MSKAKRAAALLACIGMILVLFTSSAYIALEAGHDCVGEHCEVCEYIGEAMAILRGFGLMVAAALLVCAVMALRHAIHRTEGIWLHPACTPVSWKVRLNN